MRLITIWIIGNIGLLLFGCGEESIEEIQSESESEYLTETLNLFTENEWTVIESLSPLPDKPPPSPTNRFADNPDAAQLGQTISVKCIRVIMPYLHHIGKENPFSKKS